MHNPNSFHLIVTLIAKSPDNIEPLTDALARMRPVCLAEPGCIDWNAYHSQEMPDRFFLVEEWETKAHWEAHGDLSAIQDIYLPEVLPRITREVHPCVQVK